MLKCEKPRATQGCEWKDRVLQTFHIRGSIGAPSGAVKTRLHRARAALKLKKVLKQLVPTDN